MGVSQGVWEKPLGSGSQAGCEPSGVTLGKSVLPSEPQFPCFSTGTAPTPSEGPEQRRGQGRGCQTGPGSILLPSFLAG